MQRQQQQQEERGRMKPSSSGNRVSLLVLLLLATPILTSAFLLSRVSKRPNKSLLLRHDSNNNNNNHLIHHHHEEDEDDEMKKLNLKILLIDHYDSYTYNLYHILDTILIESPIVLTCDDVNLKEEQHITTTTTFDAIVLSPGPGRPEGNFHDMGYTLDLIQRNPSCPILGVCLGHQALGYVYGATIEQLSRPIHGQVHSLDILDPTDVLFQNMKTKTKIQVTRYHSLHVTNLPSCLIPTSSITTTNNDVCLMSFRHLQYPHYGVQFHPESIGSEPFGKQMLMNFLNSVDVVDRKESSLERKEGIRWKRPSPPLFVAQKTTTTTTTRQEEPSITQQQQPKQQYHVYIEKIESSGTRAATPSAVLQEIFGSSDTKIWLDSASSTTSSSSPSAASSRFSILAGHENDLRIEYYGMEHSLEKRGIWTSRGGTQQEEHYPNETILTYLDQQLCRNDIVLHSTLSKNNNNNNTPILPFDYRGGYIGYFGYETRLITLPKQKSTTTTTNTRTNDVPTAAFLFATKSLIYDHLYHDWYIIQVIDNNRSDHDDCKWMQHTMERIRNLKDQNDSLTDSLTDSSALMKNKNNQKPDVNRVNGSSNNDYSKTTIATKRPPGRITFSSSSSSSTLPPQTKTATNHDSTINNEQSRLRADAGTTSSRRTLSRKRPALSFYPNRSKSTYLSNIYNCLHKIRQGESYELCLTNQLESEINLGVDTTTTTTTVNKELSSSSSRQFFNLYQTLRKRNPAPFAGYVEWKSTSFTKKDSSSNFYLCCSSPERFLRVKPKEVESSRNDDDHEETLGMKDDAGSSFTDNKIWSPSQNHQHQQQQQQEEYLVVETKPIKGTVERNLFNIQDDMKRARQLQSSTKNRAENLMIVDLLRNDLSKVCNKVTVPKLMSIESYTTVHQLVSTIKGELMLYNNNKNNKNDDNDKASSTRSSSMNNNNKVDDYNNNINNNKEQSSSSFSSPLIQLLRSCFPGGSMTGAPKLRSIQILHEEMEEHVPRGCYSGTLGYLSLCGHAMDFNIIIRSAIIIPTNNTTSKTTTTTTNNNNNNLSLPTTTTTTSQERKNNNNNNNENSWKISIGAGGAITDLSDPQEEYDEMMLKAKAIIDACQDWWQQVQIQEEEEEEASSGAVSVQTNTSTKNNNKNESRSLHQEEEELPDSISNDNGNDPKDNKRSNLKKETTTTITSTKNRKKPLWMANNNNNNLLSFRGRQHRLSYNRKRHSKQKDDPKEEEIKQHEKVSTSSAASHHYENRILLHSQHQNRTKSG